MSILIKNAIILLMTEEMPSTTYADMYIHMDHIANTA